MIRRSFLALSVSSLACARTTATGPAISTPAPVPPPPPREREDPGGREVFAAAKLEGTFVLRSLDTGEQIVTDAELAGVRELPASTFKIPCALIALGLGIVDGPDARQAWDGVQRRIPHWNRDHTLASAMRDSAVWYFQALARQIGEAPMVRALREMSYGSAVIGPKIDEFWLDGSLTISPREQVVMLARLKARALPVPTRAHEQVEHMITRAQQPGWSWRGKTGLGDREGRAVGWLVGLTEREGTRWAYALMVRAPQAEVDRMIPLRPALARELLIRYGALPAEDA